MKVHIPDTVKEYEPELRLLFDLMVVKLTQNRHKGWGGANYFKLRHGLAGEIEELDAAMKNENQMAAVMEAVDVANFGVLAAIMLLRYDKAEFKHLQTAIQHEETNGQSRKKTPKNATTTVRNSTLG